MTEQISDNRRVVIFGAGPAGLTAGYELIKVGYQVVILEKDPNYVGGISRTVKYKDYRFDIGGHRFFSKNEDVVRWWYDIMGEDFLTRNRISRWLYRGKFFNYPIQIGEVIQKFGLGFASKIGASLIWRKLFPINPVENLEDWFKNEFGNFLAKPFFIDYNEKLWGIPCKELSLDFANQRIKGVSVLNTLLQSFKSGLGIKNDVKSFIHEFNYPKHGPGELWERVAERIQVLGGQISMGSDVTKVNVRDNRVVSCTTSDGVSEMEIEGDYFLSSMPFNELAIKISPSLDDEALTAAKALKFRDFVTVAIVIDKPFVSEDTWVYTHDEGMRSIRFQNFKNWSPFMVPNDDETVIGLEYTCTLGDEFWRLSDDELADQGKVDFLRLGFAEESEIKETCVVRLQNVYPVYQLGYSEKVDTLRERLFQIENLYPFGRGGIHRYNNSDHSMMTAFLTVKNVMEHKRVYDVFNVNQDAVYHEEEKR